MAKNLHIFTTVSVMAAFIFGTAFFSQTELTANNSGAPSMRTGSPGDTKSCTTCHIGTAQNVTGMMTSNVPPQGYVPGSTYIIEATCVDAAKNRFGFEISPQSVAGAKLGILTITDIARTKLIGSGKYVTHTAAGTSGTGTITWSFNWTAPQAGTGDVIFYGAFNFTNHNNASSGDVIKLSQLLVSEDINTSAENIIHAEEITVYPNPVVDRVMITTPSSSRPGSVRIFAMNGSLVGSYAIPVNQGKTELNFSEFSAGTYFVYFETEKGTISRKLIKL